MTEPAFAITCDSEGNPVVLDRDGQVIPRSPSQDEYANLPGWCLANGPNSLQIDLTRVSDYRPPRNRSPHAPESFNPWLGRGIGLLQTVGGVLEVAGGVGLLIVPEPTMATKAGGIILVLHGIDTFVAGARSLWYGDPAETLTHQLASGGARVLGADETTARVVGVGADLAAGLGPSTAVSISRRAAITTATESANTISLAFMRSTGEVPTVSGTLTLPTGHVTVGIRQGAGTTRWVDAVIDGRSVRDPLRIRELFRTPDPSRYTFTTVAVAANDARHAARAADALAIRMAEQRLVWQMLGPNCATTAAEILRAGRIAIPYGMQFVPYTIHVGLRHGYTITGVGGGIAATAPEIMQFLGSRY